MSRISHVLPRAPSTETARLGILVVAGVVCAALLFLADPYTTQSGAPSPYQAYAPLARSYLAAAIRKDSLELTRFSGSAEAVTWALAVGRHYPDSLAPWAERAQVWSGYKRGDTTEVLLYATSEVCSEHPIWMRFLGDPSDAKVVGVGSKCFEKS
ncbi:MAG TPA: hypothetical protein VH764_18920 [Gemmatimonadales bacterium]|jgi:hypothetical protein